jgi:hypothetical protein
MSRRKLEALAEAIIHYSGYLEPGSPLNDARNPGGLKAMGLTQSRDDKGNRTFRSMIDGIQALFYDVDLKINGRSRAQLKPDNTLMDLSNAYNLPITTATAWARHLKKALHDETLNARTSLSYFLGE